MAMRIATPGGMAGTLRRITRLNPSTITARNTASSSGLTISPNHRRAATARMTAMITRALREMAEVVTDCIANGNALSKRAPTHRSAARRPASTHVGA